MTACHEIEVCVHCHDVSIHPISSIMGLNSMMIVMLIYLDFDYKKQYPYIDRKHFFAIIIYYTYDG